MRASVNRSLQFALMCSVIIISSHAVASPLEISTEEFKKAAAKLSVNAVASQPVAVKDPFEKVNRKIFKFNMFLDKHILLPVARTYKKVAPPVLQTSVRNFFNNIVEPYSSVNLLLQGNVRSAVRGIGRFTVNTLTSLGIGDPAAEIMHLQREPTQDFGETLGHWGIHSGPYLMLPFRGPSTLRDTATATVDYLGGMHVFLNTSKSYTPAVLLSGISTRAQLIGLEDINRGDQYALLRDVYLQQRYYAIKGGDAPPVVDNSFGDDTDTAVPAADSSAPAPSATTPSLQPDGAQSTAAPATASQAAMPEATTATPNNAPVIDTSFGDDAPTPANTAAPVVQPAQTSPIEF